MEPNSPMPRKGATVQLVVAITMGIVSALLVLALLSYGRLLGKGEESRTAGPLPVSSKAAPSAPQPALSEGDPVLACPARGATRPSGALVRLSCHSARRIVTQVRGRLALPPTAPDAGSFALGLVDWLDPHGLWSAAPDSPVGPLARARAVAMVRELEESPESSHPCEIAQELGAGVRGWVSELRGEFDRGQARATPLGRRQALELLRTTPFEDEPVRHPARQLAQELGFRAGTFGQVFGVEAKRISGVARERFVPGLSPAEWAEVVLTAAVRAYVAGVDPHGLWAPLEEEYAVYAAETEGWGNRLWGDMIRTTVGVRIMATPALPLEKDDLVLSIAGVETAGLSVEETEQLSLLAPEPAAGPRAVTVLRAGNEAPLVLLVPATGDAGESEPEPLGFDKVPFGRGSVAVIPLREVSDDLGEALANTVATLDGSTQGVLLDLRANGGGSTDGAAGVIGAFLPGVPSFPARKRDGTVEVMRALAPPPRGIYHGPVAVLVDGQTASAAEMIASAIRSYGRGPVIGSRTFGKGCIQEYFDDRAGAGVLRLTTMLFAAPDGNPIQGVGLLPDIDLALLAQSSQRESDLPMSAPSWAGPDVRDPRVPKGPAWPAHFGRVGPCRDQVLCLALRRIGIGTAPQETHANPSTAAAEKPASRRGRAGQPDPSR